MCRRPDVQNYYILSLPRGMVLWAKVSFQEVWDRCPRGCRVIYYKKHTVALVVIESNYKNWGVALGVTESYYKN